MLAKFVPVRHFFGSDTKVHDATLRLARRLKDLKVDYCVLGGNAVYAHGYKRATHDINVLLRPESRAEFAKSLLGRGYRAKFPGSLNKFVDSYDDIPIDIVCSGEYLGHNQKEVVFPDPVSASYPWSIGGVDVCFMDLDHLISLKLASYKDRPEDRLKDLVDVRELIRANSLDATFAAKVYPEVRALFLEQLAIVQRAHSRHEL